MFREYFSRYSGTPGTPGAPGAPGAPGTPGDPMDRRAGLRKKSKHVEYPDHLRY